MFVYLSIYQSSVCLPITCLSVICLFYLSIYLFTYLSTSIICLSFICLSIYHHLSMKRVFIFSYCVYNCLFLQNNLYYYTYDIFQAWLLFLPGIICLYCLLDIPNTVSKISHLILPFFTLTFCWSVLCSHYFLNSLCLLPICFCFMFLHCYSKMFHLCLKSIIDSFFLELSFIFIEHTITQREVEINFLIPCNPNFFIYFYFTESLAATKF